MEAFYYPISLFIERPYLAVLPALIFGFVYYRLYRSSAAGARRIVLTVAIIWLLYAIYEWKMYLWSQTVTAPIRVDMLLIAPVLYLATIAGLVACVFGFRHSPTARGDFQ